MAPPTLDRIVQQLRAASDQAAETDRALLERFTRAADEEAFAVLVRRHGAAVLAACRRVLTDQAEVEDAFQATFLVLLRKAGSVDWQASLRGWLSATAHRVAVHARAEARRRQDRETTGARRHTSAPPLDLSWVEAVAVLHEELDRLPGRYRRVLLLCYLNGQSRDEAAATLGWSCRRFRKAGDGLSNSAAGPTAAHAEREPERRERARGPKRATGAAHRYFGRPCRATPLNGRPGRACPGRARGKSPS